MRVDPASITLETYELVLLRRTRQAREFDEETVERIFLEHLEYTMGLVGSGQQVAAGPVRDSPAEEEHICGMGLFQQGSLDKARELANADPGVRQGLYRADVMTWKTPAGRITFPGPPPGRPQPSGGASGARRRPPDADDHGNLALPPTPQP